MKILLSFFLLLSFIGISHARVEVHQFENSQQEQRYKFLINELRCLVCQNQNLADSNAELAQDLRNQVYKMINENQSDQAILDFMVTRYGDFVLYRPPFKATTFLLWAGPFIILLLGLSILIFFIRKRKQTLMPEINERDKEKLKNLLGSNDTKEEQEK